MEDKLQEAQRAWKKAEARAVRAVAGAQRRGRGFRHLAVWGSALLLVLLYLSYWTSAFLEYDSVTHDNIDPEFAGASSAWSVLCMAVLPLWASLLVLVSCALSFPAERAAGTLEGLRLTPLPGRALARALMRPRLRFGLVVLLVGLPFYLVPRGLPPVSGEWMEPFAVAHTVLISTFGRGYTALGFSGSYSAVSTYGSPFLDANVESMFFHSLCGGFPAFIVDATRLYAMAAIATAVSMRARSAARAVFWSLVWGLVFLAVTVGAEWLGALVVLSWGPRYVMQGCFTLAAAALVLEAGIGNLLVPRLILRAAARRAERWFAGAG